MSRDRNFKDRMPREKKHQSVLQRKRKQYDTAGGGTDRFGLLLSSLGNEQVSRLVEGGGIQAKLDMSQPGDFYEQQADMIAEQMVQMKPGDGASDLKIDKLQAKGGSGGTVPSGVESGIKQLKGKGSSMNRPLRDFFEPRLGVDLGNVRIHTDSNANCLARSVNARAFTYQNEIVFGKGEFQPGSTEGKRLIGHELVHTVQQTGGVQKKNLVGTYTWEQTNAFHFDWQSRRVEINNRTVDEWMDFLKHAETAERALELSLYMALDLYGENGFWSAMTSMPATVELRNPRFISPYAQYGVNIGRQVGIAHPENLMIAMLRAGNDLNVQNSPFEEYGDMRIKYDLYKLLYGFTEKYFAQALASLSFEEFSRANIDAFLNTIREATYFAEGMWAYKDLDIPVIQGTMSAAISHIDRVLNDAIVNPGENLQGREEYMNRIMNTGVTVGTVLKNTREYEEQQAQMLSFSIGFIVDVAAGGLGSLATKAIHSMALEIGKYLARDGLVAILSSNRNSRSEQMRIQFITAFGEAVRILDESTFDSDDPIRNSSIKEDLGGVLNDAKLHFLNGLVAGNTDS